MQLEAYYILLHCKLKIKLYTHWNRNWLKKYMPNCLSYLTVNLFLFCSVVIIQLRSLSLKSELQFLFASEMGKILYSTLTLNFKDWPFGMVIIPNFRPKPGHLNDRVYCKPIDRTLKMLFSERSDSFLRPTIVVEVSGFWIKKINIRWF